jgi:hypothetical protein
MNKRGIISALSLGSGTLFSLPAIAGIAGSDRKSCQPDGLGYRARIGLLTPNDDAVPESEFWTMAPEGVSIHVSRVLLVDTRNLQIHPIQTTPLSFWPRCLCKRSFLPLLPLATFRVLMGSRP